VPSGSNARNQACHWDSIPGARNPQARTVVWVCEYPYRTIRLSGPDEDCEDCPHRPQTQASAQPQPVNRLPIDRPAASHAAPAAVRGQARILRIASARQP